jgi:thioredoxin-like negative regulator of GroEL
VLRGFHRLCFVAGLGILFGGWMLALGVVSWRDGRPPALWLEDGREIERARRARDFQSASEQARVRGVLLARPALLRDAANLALQAEDPQLGVAALRRLVRLEPQNLKARMQLVAALLQEGRRRDAADELESILEIAPRHERARKTLTRIEQELGAPL